MLRPSLGMLALIFAGLEVSACARNVAASEPSPRVESAIAQVLSTGAGAIYLRIVNEADTPEVLESVDVAEVADAQLHEVVMEAELSTMRAAPRGFRIPPHSTLSLQRGGKHVMLFGVKNPEQVPALHLRLHFRRANFVTVNVPVRHGIDLGEVSQ
jgi:copper(I)-binding protein